MSNEIFEPGDVVTCAFFRDGEFVLEETNKNYGYDEKYPITVRFLTDNGVNRDEVFTRDGFSHVYHTAPVLKLVRKKSKEREWIQVFRVTSKNESFYLGKNDFESYDEAFFWIKGNGIPSWEYQVEKFYKVKE